ncbi:MAG: metal-dependent transcriptional regulator, partial [Gemmatimonadetes bacterium]|nr:metal-dependent transcriptional regulator [Gemmatimonadota bacterium]
MGADRDMADSVRNLTRSVEDYLKTIYHLSERGEVASTSSIADLLAVQPAS